MNGSFSKEALEEFSSLVSEVKDFSYSETYDFTRCVRPDGSAYGTSGVCRKGSKADKVEKEKTKKSAKPKSKEKTAQEAEKKERIPMYSYLRGKDVSTWALDMDTDSWRRSSGLALPPLDPGGNINKHDRVHILFHQFLGGKLSGTEAIGKWLGTWQKSPTVAEEIFVGRLHEAAQARGKGENHKLSDEELGEKIATDLKGLKELGQITDSELTKYYKNGKPDVDKFVKKFREFEDTPHYETLLDAANTAFPNYKEAASG